MCSFQQLRKRFSSFKESISDPSINSLIYIISFIPKIFGYYVLGESVSKAYWIQHIALFAYIYGAGALVYQIKFANTVIEFVKNYLDMSIVILISNMTTWFLTRRNLLKEVIQLVLKNDRLVNRRKKFHKLHASFLKTTKIVLITYLIANICNDIMYIAQRVNVKNNFGMAICTGMEPLDVSPSHEICLLFLFITEVNVGFMVTYYHSTYVFLLCHTTSMYEMLTAEILDLAKEENAKEILHDLIKRHGVLLQTIDKLKYLYSRPIGIDFTSNAVMICLVLFVPFEEFLNFIFVLSYGLALFFLYCLLGQRLTNAAERFASAVYVCGWERLELNEKKLVYVMLRQAQKPVFLLAGNIVPVKLYTFASTCQTIYKFVTVLKF